MPKGLIPQVLAELRQIELQAPIKVGSVVIDNVAGTGIAVLASRDMPKA
jgi:CxxC motif-containing protein